VAEYKITIKPSALKELDGIPKKIAQQIVRRIQQLSSNPRPVGSQKLCGQERYRIRQGGYRVVYGIRDHEKIVDVVKIAHRREVYL
jgi:mRNA interferase RelE/StbE